jgi:hypothetical protein
MKASTPDPLRDEAACLRQAEACPTLSGLQTAAAAGQAFAEKVHALLDRHREPSADELFELPVALLAHGVERLPAGG